MKKLEYMIVFSIMVPFSVICCALAIERHMTWDTANKTTDELQMDPINDLETIEGF